MKILIFADSHGSTQPMIDAVFTEQPGLVLHLGDHDSDCGGIREAFPDMMIRAVRGNCDRLSKEIENDEFVAEGKRIFMTHGHLYGVKFSLTNILGEAASRGADILLFGHTHRPVNKRENGIYVVNPGAAGTGGKTYAALEIERGAVNCVIKRA